MYISRSKTDIIESVQTDEAVYAGEKSKVR